MKKLLFLLCLSTFVFASAHAQTLGFFQIADMVRLSNGQVDNILIKTGKFKLNDKQEVQGKILSTYQSIDKNKNAIKGETLVIGNYAKNKNGDKLHIITYNSIYPGFITNLMKQMVSLGYIQGLNGSDKVFRRYIYDNSLYHVVVTMRHDATINSIEIREKDLGME